MGGLDGGFLTYNPFQEGFTPPLIPSPATQPGGAADGRRPLVRFQTDFKTGPILDPFLEHCLINFESLWGGGPFPIILAFKHHTKTGPVLDPHW